MRISSTSVAITSSSKIPAPARWSAPTRLQTGQLAAANHGYYSAQEFDFTPFEPIRCETVELGRACVHKDHRKLAVLNLLWRGIAIYATERKARYLIGCSSLTSQDAAVGIAMYQALAAGHLVEERFRTEAIGAYRIAGAFPSTEPPAVPKLLRAYLSIGARICGSPALDQDFKTIDFLTLLDLHALPAAVRSTSSPRCHPERSVNGVEGPPSHHQR
ncbi:MAG: GNAT family N-acyltransferase [Chthoniobacter sp.]